MELDVCHRCSESSFVLVWLFFGSVDRTALMTASTSRLVLLEGQHKFADEVQHQQRGQAPSLVDPSAEDNGDRHCPQKVISIDP
ncbi:hypothetical protein BIW11_07401 [Tropilaelaps mercedesae]|uniref:Uncharacterized protein n=1 Tax=Tropilaelaps mercedesae TaxID=418985 RepID=A0A1V9XU34_9ACAR|nr:hypothetical protein BIW11_07401 [Tropilaelaps mercedesae]